MTYKLYIKRIEENPRPYVLNVLYIIITNINYKIMIITLLPLNKTNYTSNVLNKIQPRSSARAGRRAGLSPSAAAPISYNIL